MPVPCPCTQVGKRGRIRNPLGRKVRGFESHRGRYLICRVDREADGARLESELSEIWHTGSNPVPYATGANSY